MESTLSLTITQLKAEVGDYLGYGRGAETYGEETWTTAKANDIQSCVESGLRRVYFQAMTPAGTLHRWSFLSPVASVNLASGSRYADLPEDFGGVLDGRVAVNSTSGGFLPVKLVNEAMVRQAYAATPSVTGRPAWVALEPLRGTQPSRGTRYRLYVYPEPNDDYELRLNYSILPDYLTAANPYPYGGAQHAETFKAACRAAAERLRDNAIGPEDAYYRECLTTSIERDGQTKPQSVGYNRDRSDDRTGREWWRGGNWYWPASVTYGGTAPDDF